MGFFDFLKKKEFTEIESLKNALQDKDKKIHFLSDQITALSKYQSIVDIETKIKELLDSAEREASQIIHKAKEQALSLTTEANRMYTAAEQAQKNAESTATTTLESANTAADSILKEARSRANELKTKANNILNSATQQAAEIINKANIRAEEIAGDAFKIKNETEDLSKTVIALKNTIKGYGDDYLVPTYSILDGLAEEFGYTEAGEELKKARERSRLMVKNKTAATCDYVEDNRKNTAINFVTDAFNGKVDSILSTIKQDNFGTLKQKIIDAYHLVNNLGKAFRNATITPEYLDSRIEELKWGAIVFELKIKEKEEQRRIKEQIREEEKARREFEKAIKESEKEEELLKKALEKARKELAEATDEQKQKYEARLEELNERLRIAEEKGQRALSMAQQTRSGHVYIISNIGSFGENVYKIGMTRRLEPTDRVRELGDASVPFSFDIHAMIYSDDAPTLETELHKYFMAAQVNKVNPRKEFFRIGLKEIREKVISMELQTKWTMTSEATEYRESLAIENALKKDPQKQAEWESSQTEIINEEELEEVEN